ncbi:MULTISPECIES: class I SAM-dependent DNA methyltransferase [Sphingomonadaceae]|uniref:Methyltransferase n=1 Tax=Sphingomonas bisphenolicum TaxID=296544 RepID=A0ABM7G0M5_9SPHN|nr:MULTISPECIES: nodulation S family protein [Sphingomonadaceae]WCP12327.1 Ubiquinone biosynthesis O-methyltransferase, mitochondrial [Sphingobium sp. AntQ-1]BBF70917.1 methyltransferase [Sphingomonas bisphenolicum]
MTRHEASLDADYFEGMFRGTDDPWDLESSDYEREKYAHTLLALGSRHYELGFEVGCAKGVLTRGLAEHCRALLAIDISETALKAARERCETFDQISFARMAFPDEAPLGSAFDLIILSEVVYYWDDGDIGRAAEWIDTHLAEGGDLLLVHWTGETDYPQGGDEAVAKMRDALDAPLLVVAAERRDRYRLDLWRHAS